MAKRRTTLPTLLSIGLLMFLMLWMMYETMRLSALQRQQQRRVGEMTLTMVRELMLSAVASKPADWRDAARRLAAVSGAAGIVHAQVQVGNRTMLEYGRDPFVRQATGPAGYRSYGDRVQIWDSRSWSGPLPKGGQGQPMRLLLALDLGELSPRLAEVDRLVLIALLLGCGMVFIFLLAWIASVRNRNLELQLAKVRVGREFHEELGLAATGLAHETKNPLGVIRGLAQQIATDPEHSETARRATSIMEEADITTDRLGNFLRYARIRKPTLQPLAALPQLERMAGLVAAEFQASGIDFQLKLAPLFILADAEMLSQVVLNLLLNSRRFTPPGGRVTLTLQAVDANHAELTVADTGEGIPAELLPNLFRPYVGRSDGHGLGLAIVKRIVDQSGWKIAIHSPPGQGTTVVIRELIITDGAPP